MDARIRIQLTREDILEAIRDIDTYVDVTPEDFLEIYQMAIKHAELREAERMPIRALMTTEVITVQPQLSLAQAARLLLDNRISGLPVVDPEQRLIGIVTEADFLSAMGLPSHHPRSTIWDTLESMFHHRRSITGLRGTVDEIMYRKPVATGPDASLQEAIEQMRRNSIKRLVVIDGEKRVIGIVTRSNIVRLFLEHG